MRRQEATSRTSVVHARAESDASCDALLDAILFRVLRDSMYLQLCIYSLAVAVKPDIFHIELHVT